MMLASRKGGNARQHSSWSRKTTDGRCHESVTRVVVVNGVASRKKEKAGGLPDPALLARDRELFLAYTEQREQSGKVETAGTIRRMGNRGWSFFPREKEPNIALSKKKKKKKKKKE